MRLGIEVRLKLFRDGESRVRDCGRDCGREREAERGRRASRAGWIVPSGPIFTSRWSSSIKSSFS